MKRKWNALKTLDTGESIEKRDLEKRDQERVSAAARNGWCTIEKINKVFGHCIFLVGNFHLTL